MGHVIKLSSPVLSRMLLLVLQRVFDLEIGAGRLAEMVNRRLAGDLSTKGPFEIVGYPGVRSCSERR